MNRVLIVVGVILLSLGLLSLKYRSYSWVEESTTTISTPIGDIELPDNRVHSVSVPSSVSWGAAVVGLVLVVAGLAAPTKPASSEEAP